MLEAPKENSRYSHQPITIGVDGSVQIKMIERKQFVKLLTSLEKTAWNWLLTSQYSIDGAPKSCPRVNVENHHLVLDIRNLLDGTS